jgi:murein DD-endopeptidase MepM/ murein hydrolase activator NlpD
MSKKGKIVRVQMYSKGTDRPKSYSIPLKVIGWWLIGFIIIVLGFIFWLPDNMLNLKNFHVFEMAKEQRAMQLTANKLEKQISEVNSQIENGRNLRKKINELSGISNSPDDSKNDLIIKDGYGLFVDIDRIEKSLKTLRKMRDALLEEEAEQYVKNLPLLHPLKKHQSITNRFGLVQDILTKRELPHMGLDFAVSEGDTVIATGDGIVDAVINRKFGFGMSLEIQHTPNIKTVYSHLHSVLVQKGKPVKKGQPIAITGKSGSVLWPVLHYEVLYDNQPLNPEDYFITS